MKLSKDGQKVIGSKENISCDSLGISGVDTSSSSIYSIGWVLNLEMMIKLLFQYLPIKSDKYRKL